MVFGDPPPLSPSLIKGGGRKIREGLESLKEGETPIGWVGGKKENC